MSLWRSDSTIRSAFRSWRRFSKTKSRNRPPAKSLVLRKRSSRWARSRLPAFAPRRWTSPKSIAKLSERRFMLPDYSRKASPERHLRCRPSHMAEDLEFIAERLGVISEVRELPKSRGRQKCQHRIRLVSPFVDASL